ncbi:hypothetical protein NEA10_09180 [Phormidium yuhuli AB48]|uniref:Uncharacterized protein n=1 Tax=Phormidium yuhuli AB48 TaxID=2940671 RepID=A0ABY5AUG1_9CYAN|nr:hypothetical protein [Phormidium yuhuli]USR92867.1 hypothetical protein NEA10_09180 [Phormidium yuhuli AB48]
MSLSPPSTRPHSHYLPTKHPSETCRLWERECLRAWLEMKRDLAEVQQHQPH